VLMLNRKLATALATAVHRLRIGHPQPTCRQMKSDIDQPDHSGVAGDDSDGEPRPIEADYYQRRAQSRSR
jgi:hypothetical protein